SINRQETALGIRMQNYCSAGSPLLFAWQDFRSQLAIYGKDHSSKVCFQQNLLKNCQPPCWIIFS
ncbi:hypothetical protein, partial [Comamonas testosteroni]|uniref:hypothetical protein n=1 Tax=Comamonas testosteroni TaxID=285 RepID=UPI001E607F77